MTEKITNPEEKISYYRKAADEAERSASRAKDPDIRAAYLSIMRTWIYLADELEREMAFAGNETSMIDQSDEAFIAPSAKSEAHKSR